jgi:gluconolactonase
MQAGLRRIACKKNDRNAERIENEKQITMKIASIYFLFTQLVFLSLNVKAEMSITFQQEELYVSKDFTIPGLFTSSIEGPAVDSKGNLYAVNFEKSGTIGIVDTLGNARIFSTLPNGSTGNGIRFDELDNMYIADYTGHNVLIIPAGKTEAEVYAHSSNFNQPNDLAIMSNGILFASDPNWTNNNGKLWRIGTDKIPVLIDANMGTTNGIEVSPDDKYLYVNETNQLKIWKFDLNEKGEISNKTLFVSFTDFSLDGMRCDMDGNLYVARYGKGAVAIISPDGTLVREVFTTGKDISNIAFGGIDGRTCFVTMVDRQMIEMFRTETPGREWKLTAVEGIPNINLNIQTVYPNPSSSMLNISNVPVNSSISVIDMDGRAVLIRIAKSDPVTFDVSAWKRGLYLINIDSGKMVSLKKIILI